VPDLRIAASIRLVAMRWIVVRDPPWNQAMISEAGRMKLGMIQRSEHREIFLTFLYSRIDNTRLNFRLGIPELLQVEKF
jgi:hypothetical protein